MVKKASFLYNYIILLIFSEIENKPFKTSSADSAFPFSMYSLIFSKNFLKGSISSS